MSGIHCVVVANSVHARLFHTEGSQEPLLEQQSLLHAASRSKQQDLVSDRPGRAVGASGSSHSVGHENDAKQHEAQQFAREIANSLEQGYQRKAFYHVYVVAPARMIGLIRKALSNQLLSTVKGEIDANLVKASAAEIRAHLPQYL